MDIVELLESSIVKNDVIRAAIEEIKRLRAASRKTITVMAYFSDHSEESRVNARHNLRRMTFDDRYKKDDLTADVILERIWNILAGNS